MLPTLIFIFAGLFPEYDYLRLAVGTTVAAMTFGAVTAAITHWRAGNVEVPIFKTMIVAYVLGALAGAWINRFMPTQWLKVYLGLVLFLIGMQMLFSITTTVQDRAAKIAQPKTMQPVFFLIATITSMGGRCIGYVGDSVFVPLPDDNAACYRHVDYRCRGVYSGRFDRLR